MFTHRSDQLSVEKLLIHSIQVRGLAKLKELERELRLIVPGSCEIRDLPTVLYVPVLYPCMESERLSISVDVQKGKFLVSLCLKGIGCVHFNEKCKYYVNSLFRVRILKFTTLPEIYQWEASFKGKTPKKKKKKIWSNLISGEIRGLI